MADLLTDLEQAIANRLKPLKDHGLDIINSPHRCGGAATAVAMFYFTDTTAEEASSCSQNRDLNLTVEVEACDQRSHQIAYPYTQAIDVMLHEFDPQVGKTGHFKYVSTRYLPYEDKNGFKWIYSMTFKLRQLHCKPKDVDRALLKIFE